MITIVPFSADLQAQFIELILPIRHGESGIEVTVADQPDLLDIPHFYHVEAGGFWVALDDQQVVGTIALRDIGNHQGALRKMFVRATHRGKEHAVASRLLHHLVEQSRGADVAELFLGTTDRFLAAHRFYEKNGFSRVEPGSLPATFPRMAVDTRFYWRRIDGDVSS